MEQYKIDHPITAKIVYDTLESAIHDAVVLSMDWHELSVWDSDCLPIVRTDTSELIGVVFEGGTWCVKEKTVHDVLLSEIEQTWYADETLQITKWGQDQQGNISVRAQFFKKSKPTIVDSENTAYMPASKFYSWLKAMISLTPFYLEN